MCNHLERVALLSCIRVNHHLATVADTNKSVLILNHLLDAEALSWLICKSTPYLAIVAAL